MNLVSKCIIVAGGTASAVGAACTLKEVVAAMGHCDAACSYDWLWFIVAHMSVHLLPVLLVVCDLSVFKVCQRREILTGVSLVSLAGAVATQTVFITTCSTDTPCYTAMVVYIVTCYVTLAWIVLVAVVELVDWYRHLEHVPIYYADMYDPESP